MSQPVANNSKDLKDQRIGDGIISHSTCTPATNQTAFAEDHEVFRDGRLFRFEHGYDLGNRVLFFPKDDQNLQPKTIAQQTESASHHSKQDFGW
jgi:hypothetical protein